MLPDQQKDHPKPSRKSKECDPAPMDLTERMVAFQRRTAAYAPLHFYLNLFTHPAPAVQVVQRNG